MFQIEKIQKSKIHRRLYPLLLSMVMTAVLLVGCQNTDDAIIDAGSEHQNATEIIGDLNEPLGESEDTVVYVPKSVPNSFLENTTIAYQIFPIAYADSDGNGIGDINGITSKLDYLKDELNVDVIWLNPVHPSPSYHKYDVVDYYGVDPQLGTLDDYKRLLEEAHKRDIKVLLDFVINHTSSSHPWFLSAKSEDSTYRDYYIWNDLKTDQFNNTSAWYSVPGSEEKYFASFWSEMPELNFENPLVRDAIKDIATYWLEMGVDGFRIDAAKHIYDINEYPKGTPVLNKNFEWFVEFNQSIKEVNPNAFLLLETWDNYNSVAHFLEGADSAFNFDLGTSIISAVNSENRKNIQGKLTNIYKSYDQVTSEYVDSVFLSNHDQDRTLSQLTGDIVKAKLAATIEFTLPGISWIYYGEELGMTGMKPDENIREAFKWSGDQKDAPNSRWRLWSYNSDLMPLDQQMEDPNSMFATYKALTNLKSTHKVLNSGQYIDYEIPTSFRVFSFFRQYESQTYLIIHNLHSEDKTFELSSEPSQVIYETNGSGVVEQKMTIKPYSSLIIEVPDETITALEVK
jgi:glycosidase